MVTRHVLAAALVWGVVLAPARVAAAPAPPGALAKTLEWVPSDIRWVTHQGPGMIGYFRYARSTLGDRCPACFDALEHKGAHLFQLCRFPGGRCYGAAHGFTDRVAVEQCAAETFRALTGRAVTLDRQGRLTRASSGKKAIYLAWSDDGWLYFDEDPARVEAMLDRRRAPTLAPALRRLLARVSLEDPFWTVFAGDLTTRFIGVPSTGLVQQGSVTPSSTDVSRATKIPVTFLFHTEVEARRAIEALARSARNDELPPPLRNALSALRPARRGREVDIDVAIFVTDLRALDAANAVMKQRWGAPPVEK